MECHFLDFFVIRDYSLEFDSGMALGGVVLCKGKKIPLDSFFDKGDENGYWVS